jgi:hypothetical protein
MLGIILTRDEPAQGLARELNSRFAGSHGPQYGITRGVVERDTQMQRLTRCGTPFRGACTGLDKTRDFGTQITAISLASSSGSRSRIAGPRRAATKNSRRWRDAPIDKKCNLDRRIVVVCCPELERVRPVIVRGSTAPPAQVHQ